MNPILDPASRPPPSLQCTLHSQIRRLHQKLLSCKERSSFAACIANLKGVYNVDTIRSDLVNWLKQCYQSADMESPDVLLAIQKSLDQAPATSPIRTSPQHKLLAHPPQRHQYWEWGVWIWGSTSQFHFLAISSLPSIFVKSVVTCLMRLNVEGMRRLMNGCRPSSAPQFAP